MIMALYIILVLVILILFGVAIFDIETSTIPHTLTIFLLILGICYCVIKKDFKPYFTLPIVGVIFILQIILFFIFGEDAIGGGDVKILSISALFLHNFNDVGNYCISLCLYTFFAFVIAKYNKESHIKYGPYMSLTLISTLMSSLYCSISSIILFDSIFILSVFLIDILFFFNRRVIENVQKNNFFYKK